jgi:hypothetical protein
MTILFEVDTPEFETVRAGLSAFSELEKSPEYIHTYRVTRSVSGTPLRAASLSKKSKPS